MRTKEEIFKNEDNAMTKYHSPLNPIGINESLLEVLIDIRDILDESRNEHFDYTFPEKKAEEE